MLVELELADFVILEGAALRFGSGLNVITGETGTGKSILCDALGFLVGARGEVGWIRQGSRGLSVRGLFDVDRLPEAAAAAERLGCRAGDGRLEIRREMGSSGRSKNWVQGKAMKVADLKMIGSELLAIHGQGEHRRLLEPTAQLELVDRYAGALAQREAYASVRGIWLEEAQRYREAKDRLTDLSEKKDWYRAQVDEIDAARICPGEEEALRGSRDGARNQTRTLEARGRADRLLFEDEGSAIDRLETILDSIGSLGERWESFHGELTAARDALRRAHRLLPEAEPLPEEDPTAIEDRLALLARLKKKYGNSEESILEHRSKLVGFLEDEESLGERLAAMEKRLEEVRTRAADAAVLLRKRRQGIAQPLCRAVMAELKSLGMTGAVLELLLDEETSDDAEGLPVGKRRLKAFPDGIDVGWFHLRPNPGEGAGPLAAIASGGELSRTLLALLSVLGGREQPRTAIFDEIDAGIGGATARAVASRLERLALDRQTLLVTHLPVIASRAECHFRVVKRRKGSRTIASVGTLDSEERIGELARMLAGEVDSRIARRHAAELLAASGGGGQTG